MYNRFMHSDVYDRLIARNYDAVYSVLRDPSGDAAFYLQQARECGGPVLELGCGTGRTLLPIGRAGIDCVGLEPSSEMLAVLREKDPPPNLCLVQGCMQELDLGDARFPLITAPFRAFSHLLTVEEQLCALGRIRQHLAPGGRFVFDLFDPKLERMALLQEPEALAATFQYEGCAVQRFDSVTRDPSTQIITLRMRFAGGPPELTGSTELPIRWFYRYEVEHLLARAGFAHVTICGGFDGRPWTAGGETVITAR